MELNSAHHISPEFLLLAVKNVDYLLKNNHKSLLVSFLKSSMIDRASIPYVATQIIGFYQGQNQLIPEDLDKAITSNLMLNLAVSKIRTRELIPVSQINRMKKELMNAVDAKDPNAADLARQLLTQISDRLPLKTSEEYYRKIISIGHELLYANMPEVAQGYFEAAEKVAPRDYRDEAVFWQLWRFILEGRNDLAFKFINEKGLYDIYSKLDPKLKFWIAYTYKLNRYPVLATHLFKMLVNEPTIGYYTILGIRELTELNENTTAKKLMDSYKKVEQTTLAVSLSVDEIVAIKRIKIWSRLGLDQQVTNEVLKLLGKQKNNKSMVTLISNILNEQKQYLHTFKVVHQIFKEQLATPNRALLGNLFPVLYANEVKGVDKNIDPLLIISLIRQESAFDPKARSIAGARGLMQIMPATLRTLGGNRHTDMNSPQSNLKYGIKYFKQLLSKYDGSIIHSLAAYNAGPHRVEKWQNKYLRSENPLFNIESIPYEETRIYVKLIYRNYFFYNLLTNDTDLKKPIVDSFKTTASY